MGANAQTTVPTFTAGEVLTAAQQNQSARTGVPVFATTGTRDAGFGGTGEKTLAEGQLCYVEGTGLQSYNGTSWVTWGASPSSGALTYITSGTLSGASTTISNAFSATYNNYFVTFEKVKAGGVGPFYLAIGAAATAYYGSYFGATLLTGNFVANPVVNGTAFYYAVTNSTQENSYYCYIFSPYLTERTWVQGSSAERDITGGSAAALAFGGMLNNTTSYTSLVLSTTAGGGGFTSGTVKIYGIANS